jgi:hypothetical protein
VGGNRRRPEHQSRRFPLSPNVLSAGPARDPHHQHTISATPLTRSNPTLRHTILSSTENLPCTGPVFTTRVSVHNTSSRCDVQNMLRQNSDPNQQSSPAAVFLLLISPRPSVSDSSNAQARVCSTLRPASVSPVAMHRCAVIVLRTMKLLVFFSLALLLLPLGLHLRLFPCICPFRIFLSRLLIVSVSSAASHTRLHPPAAEERARDKP